MDFEGYLVSKKIDGELFRRHEPLIWSAWKAEFELIHPNSFTAQKLYLINPIRRKYPLKVDAAVSPAPEKKVEVSPKVESTPVVSAKPAVPRPVFKPKIKPPDHV
jgi:hypothetical protein